MSPPRQESESALRQPARQRQLTIRLCGDSAQASLTAGDTIVVTCGSVTMSVVAGTVEISYLAADGSEATATVDQGNRLTFEADDATLIVSAENVSTVVINSGGMLLDIQPGHTVMLIKLVLLDVKPGTSTNSINLNSGGTVPAAILSTATFSAPLEVDADTLSLIGANVNLIGKSGRLQCSNEDVNADGFVDLMCHFVTADFDLQLGGSLAVALGRTFAGRTIRGEDFVNVVP